MSRGVYDGVYSGLRNRSLIRLLMCAAQLKASVEAGAFPESVFLHGTKNPGLPGAKMMTNLLVKPKAPHALKRALATLRSKRPNWWGDMPLLVLGAVPAKSSVEDSRRAASSGETTE